MIATDHITKSLILCCVFLVFALALPSLIGRSYVDSKPIINAESTVEFRSEADASVKPMIRVFIHPDDIYPSLIRARPGLLRFRAENETLTDVTLVLERIVSGHSTQEVARVSTVRQANRADQEVGLGVGQYVFYEASRPEIKGTLIVDPQQN